MLLNEKINLITIASSTGGPQTLRVVLRGLRRLNCAVVIVQHMQASAIELFRKSLDRLTEMDAVMAQDGMKLEHGVVYLAPTGYHASISGGRFTLFQADPVNFCMPAADVTMESIQPGDFREMASIVLTGLGRDGANGTVAMKRQGAFCMAQDPATSIVASMPMSAIQTGAVDRVLDPEELRAAILALAG